MGLSHTVTSIAGRVSCGNGLGDLALLCLDWVKQSKHSVGADFIKLHG